MKPVCLLFIFILIHHLAIRAQSTNCRISGTVSTLQNNPLPGATVTLLQPGNAAFNKSMAVGEDGRFAFKKLHEGRYVFTITNIGYKKYSSDTLTIDTAHCNLLLPVVVLQPTAQKALQQVTVTANRPLVEQRVDRTIVNVEALLTAAGSNALEVLARSPGVTVQPDGDISLYRKGGVLVLIDNRPTYLSAQELAAYLRSLPAGMIDQLELISQPPARYDASGSAIINIKLKKNRAPGLNGSVLASYSQGRYRRNNEAVVINYKKQKINWFASLSHTTDGNYNKETTERYYTNPDGSPAQSLLINKWYTYRSEGINLRTGVDYFASAQTTVGLLLTGGVRPRSDQFSYDSRQHDYTTNSDSLINGAMQGDYQWYSGGINVNAQHAFNNKSGTLSTDVDWVTLHAGGDQYLSNQVKYNLPADIHIWSAKADYGLPLPGKLQLEAGLKTSNVRTQYNNDWFNKTTSGYTPDYGKTNHFVYEETINAAYVTLAKEWKRWSAKAGVRIENTHLHGRQLPNIVVPDSSFNRYYTNAFPDWHLLYKVDSMGNNTLALSYSRRIRRPNYQQLNPFLFFNDQYSYSGGNPLLQPQYLTGVELRYLHKNRIGVVAGYLYIDKLIQSLQETVGTVTISRPQNFGINRALAISPFVQLSLLKGWQLNASAGLFYLKNKGIADEQAINTSITTFEVEANNQFRFSKSWSGELSGNYTGPHLSGQTKNKALWRMDAALQRMVLKNRGTVKAACNDIFHTLIRRDQYVGWLLLQSQRRTENDTRRITVSFSYRFGAMTGKQRTNQHNGSSTEEQGRLQ